MARNPARNYGDELDRYKELVAEEITILRDALAVAEAKYARLMRTEVEFDPDPATRERPGLDLSLFPAAGTDVAEQYRDAARSVVNVETGGRT